MVLIVRAMRQILKQNRILGGNLKGTATKIITSKRHLSRLATLLQFSLVAAMEKPTAKPRAKAIKNANHKAESDSKAEYYLNALKVRWMQLHEIPGLFAYQLQDTRKNRRVPGNCGYYAELNVNRSLKRRVPQVIDKLNPTFKPNMFNFNKVDAMEVMLTIDNEKDNAEVQMIINKSPLTKYHTLVCPEVKSNLVQRITPSGLSFCINFMRNISDADMRMGYNSPGALASVNHLHFHLLHMPQGLYIDNVELEPLAESSYVYRLKKDSPTEAICFVIHVGDDEQVVREKIANVHKLTEWLCNNNLPHNMFITQERRHGDLRVFLFVRSKYCVNKDVTAFNIGFCEMVGFFPLNDVEKLETMTEQTIIDRITDITGNAYDSVYPQVRDIVNGTSGSLWQQPFTI